jgi:3-oxoacyl-(acyl-carrier-protein) synthase
VAPEQFPDSKVIAIQQVLKQAKVDANDIDFISAHGTSTRLNDPIETKAVKIAFGQRAYQIPMSSIKSMIGHTLGACTAIEVAATLLGMKNSFIPPTINLDHPDPECDLDYVPNNSRQKEINIALINNSGFGGRNSSILLKKWNAKS